MTTTQLLLGKVTYVLGLAHMSRKRFRRASQLRTDRLLVEHGDVPATRCNDCRDRSSAVCELSTLIGSVCLHENVFASIRTPPIAGPEHTSARRGILLIRSLRLG